MLLRLISIEQALEASTKFKCMLANLKELTQSTPNLVIFPGNNLA
jgi:hypothetical protein